MISRIFAAAFLAFSLLFVGDGGTKADVASSAVEVQFQHGLGSGVYIGRGLIVTARHVVTQASNGWIIVRDQAGEQVDARPYWVSKTTDVAVLRITGTLHIPAAQLDRRAAVLGEPVDVVGTRLGYSFTHSPGQVVSSHRQDIEEWRDAILINCNVDHGDSGGPAYDKDGKVLGIVVGALTGSIQIGVMISAREIGI